MGYIEERKNLGEISQILEKMGVPHKFEDIGGDRNEVFPAIICIYRCNNLDFDVIIYNIGQWIHVKCLIMNLEQIRSEILLSIYEIALELNYDLPEVTFSSHKNQLYIEVDCFVFTSLEDFKGEFLSIGDGIEAFITIMDKQREIALKSTVGQIRTESTSS